MNLKKKLWVVIILFVFTSWIILAGISILRVIVEDYDMKASNLPEGFILKVLFSKGTYESFLKFDNSINNFGLVLIFLMLVYIIFGGLGGLTIDKKYKESHKYGSHGTARWQTKGEIRRAYYKNDLGWFLGSVEQAQDYKPSMKAAYLAVENKKKLNMQVNVVGSPGSIKTTGFVMPNAFHIPQAYKKARLPLPDFIFTDPKSELYAKTSNRFRDNGYDVFVLDFINLLYGDSVNPIDYIEDEKELMEITKSYIKAIENAESSGRGSSAESAFWNQQEAQVLGALIGYVQQKHEKENQTMTDVLKVLTSDDVSSVDNARDFFSREGIYGSPMQLWKNFLMIADSDKTRANILGGLSGKLSLFSIPGIQNITNKTTLDLSLLGAKKERPMAVYILMPDSDLTFSPVINMIIMCMLNQMYRTAYKYDNRLYVPVYMLLDEIANIGPITGLKEKLGTMRGRRIYPMLIWQDLVQMKSLFGQDWETVLAKCDTNIYLGVNDKFTSEYVSETIGKTTVSTQGTSTTPKGYGVDTVSSSKNYAQRMLLFPDEVINMDTQLMIVRQRAANPFKLYKVQYRYWEKSLCEDAYLEELPLLGQNNIAFKISKREPDADGLSIKMPQEEREKRSDRIELKDVKEIVKPDVVDHETFTVDGFEKRGALKRNADNPFRNFDREK